jgi:hypothetical protein
MQPLQMGVALAHRGVFSALVSGVLRDGQLSKLTMWPGRVTVCTERL